MLSLLKKWWSTFTFEYALNSSWRRRPGGGTCINSVIVWLIPHIKTEMAGSLARNTFHLGTIGLRLNCPRDFGFAFWVLAIAVCQSSFEFKNLKRSEWHWIARNLISTKWPTTNTCLLNVHLNWFIKTKGASIHCQNTHEIWTNRLRATRCNFRMTGTSDSKAVSF